MMEESDPEFLPAHFSTTSNLPREEWKPPSSSEVGWKGLTAEQLREAVFADAELRLD